MISFASDNTSGVHPKVLAALEEANSGHAPAYGDDPWTARALELLRAEFGEDARAYFVFLGTGANVLGIKASLRPYDAVICADSAHIHTDECGALEAAGVKLYTVPGGKGPQTGKITPESFAHLLQFAGDVHHAWPRMVSITQSTELGTLYQPEEIRQLSAFCQANGLYLHMDGARIANAAATLGLGLREATRDLGVDVLSLGGTKNGLMYGEAVLFFNPALALDFEFFRKRHMQLGSKMRYISAQFAAYLEGGLWRENARHANAMTALLAERLQALPQIELCRKPEVNSLFALMPRKAYEAMQSRFPFYIWSQSAPGSPERPEVRLMTSFDTTERNVLDFVADLRKVLK